MAKKQKRSRKNPAPQKEAETAINEANKTGNSGALTGNEFATAIAATLGIFVYLVLFLFTKTEFGDRFGTYLVLLFNQQIYFAFWTGSPDGSFHIFDRWPILIGMVFHLGMAFGVGRLILQQVNWKSKDRWELVVLATGLGLAVISTYTVLVGLLQLYAFKQLLVLPVLIVAVAGWFRPAEMRQVRELVGHQNEELQGHWSNWIWLAGIPFAVIVVLASMIPPWEFDVREYHLQVPKEWFQQGGIGFLPHNIYGNMPLGTEMHALFAMLYAFGPDDWWWGVLIGKSLSGMFVILNALAIYLIGRRVSGKFAGGAGAIVYLSTPWTIANGIIGYNESAISFYILLAFLVFLELRSRMEGKDSSNTEPAYVPSSNFGLSLLLGLAIGSAVACKYTAIPFVALPFTVLFVASIAGCFGMQSAFNNLVWLLTGIFLVAGVWFIKNLILAGNPVYPLAESLFDSSRSQLQVDQWNSAHSPESMIPSIATLQAILYSFVLSFKWLSPLTIPFAVLALLGKQRRLAIWLGGYLVFAFMIWLVVTHRLERFLLPFYSIGCVLAGLGADWLPNRNWRNIACTILLVGCGMNLLFGSSRLVGDVRIFASMSDLDSRSLNARDYRHPEDQIIPLNHLSPTIAWLNQNHPSAKVLFFGECRPLTAEFEVIYNTCFDRCETWKRFSGQRTEEIHERLLTESITHVLINVSEWNRFQSTYGYNVGDGGNPITPDDLIKLSGSVFRRVEPNGFSPERDPAVILLEVLPK